MPEFGRRQALAHPIAGMLALIAMALCSGVTQGYDDLALYAATLSQGQLRGKTTTEVVYLISSLPLEEQDAAGLFKLKRGYWGIESRLQHALDVTPGEDCSRVGQPNAAFVLSLAESPRLRHADATVPLRRAWRGCLLGIETDLPAFPNNLDVFGQFLSLARVRLVNQRRACRGDLRISYYGKSNRH